VTLRPGDMLNCAASGGLVEQGARNVAPIGPFVPAVVGTDGTVLSPQTGPTAMLFRALAPGRARLILFTGGGMMPSARHTIEVAVEEDAPEAAGAPAVPK
jgi:hypothetical protein